VLLDVFVESIEGEEGFNINISKIRSLFTLSYVFDFLLKQDDFLAETKINMKQLKTSVNNNKDN